MNHFDSCYGCTSCDDGCNKGCTEAAYSCDFDITAAPYDPTTWLVTWCGKMHRVKIPQIAETDTTLSINYSGATLNYKAERHEDIITGAQLGSIITVGDLRDTKVDYDTEAMCYELIYHKYGECGEGCKSIENSWSTFSIDNDGALGPQIRYVRGANRYGCPYFLDVPSNPSQYWFQGWRTDTNENGYYQATPVDELPKNENGDYYVLSQYPSNKQPVVGVLPWQCMLTNIFGNLGVDVSSVWRQVQGTSGFGATFDQVEGYFTISWTDWNDLAETQRAGYGTITGKLNWDIGFDTKTGSMKYVIHNIYFDTMAWTVDQGVTQPSAPTMTLYGITFPAGQKVQIGTPITFGKQSVTRTLDATIDWEQTILVAPGQTVGPMDFAYIYVDWINDDEGYMGVKFSSKLSGYIPC